MAALTSTRWPPQAASYQPQAQSMLGQTQTVRGVMPTSMPSSVRVQSPLPATYAAPPRAAPVIGGQPFEFTPLPFAQNGPDAGSQHYGPGAARRRDGGGGVIGAPNEFEFPPEPQGGAPPGTEMRLPEGSSRPRKTRGLDPVPSPQGMPASYGSTSYGQSSYGPTSQESAVGANQEEMLKEVLNNQRRMQEELQHFQTRMDNLEQRMPGGGPGDLGFCPSPQGPGRGPPPQQGNGYDQGPPQGQYGAGPPQGDQYGPGPQQQRSFERPPPGFDGGQGHGGGGPPYGGPGSNGGAPYGSQDGARDSRGAPPGHQRGAQASSRPQRTIGICC